jgi:uncharacterized protein
VRLADLPDLAADALQHIGAYASDLARPTMRLGVTGLSRAGKTVFITALVHNLVAGGRMPFFAPVAEGRVRRAWLEPQPDDAVARFDIEDHIAALTGEPPRWPEGTRRISQLRVTLDYEPVSLWRHITGSRLLSIDIVDYPGEWLLDLPMMSLDFARWSHGALASSRVPGSATLASEWHSFLAGLGPDHAEDEVVARQGAALYTAYLQRVRDQAQGYAGLTPGRFLMPGDLAGSPALTFMPLDLTEGFNPTKGSLAAMLARRYEAYKTHVVTPFFRDHFSRLDRQIVLVDVLTALNGGAAAMTDLGQSLEAVLGAFRPGTNSWLSSILSKRIDRIAFAATKADHIHHTSHDRLEAVLGNLVGRAITRAQFAGAKVKVLAVAGVRSTREAERSDGGVTLPCVVGTPMAGERLGGKLLDGTRDVAVFPGDVPADAAAAVAGAAAGSLNVVRFRPPRLDIRGGTAAPFPHIRLDRALDFLVGDRLT